VSGRVQGVFFRSETQHIANKYNVSGWIRNLSDGSVEAVFEGHDADVDYLIKFMHRGPQSAAVTQTEVRVEPYKGEFKDFRILW
jgi:acylphosphatase